MTSRRQFLRRDDMIYALATPPGRSAIAVLRVSGAGCEAAAQRLTRGATLNPRVATLCRIYGADGRTLLDHALVLSFESGASYTGESSFEVHLHGSPVVVRAVSDSLEALGVKPAEPGEFTQRAYCAGKLDLAQVEGLDALLSAETESARRQASRVLDGEVGRLVVGWRHDLLSTAALIEAGIDFVDEGIDDDVRGRAALALSEFRRGLAAEIQQGALAELSLKPLSIAVIGAPNAGKSSFLNSVTRRDAAIVSGLPGTTRDLVTVAGRYDGLDFELIDTAGLRDQADAIEAEGIRRARKAASDAERRIFLLSADTEAPADLFMAFQEGDAVFWSKSDLLDLESAPAPEAPIRPVEISVKDDSARRAFNAALAGWRPDAASIESTIGSNDRRRRILETCDERLVLAQQALSAEQSDLAAEHVRDAAAVLEALVGSVDADEVLGEIFSRFCIGK